MITGRLEVFTVIAIIVAIFQRLRDYRFTH
jgi:Trk-type K+ transport system membrane component